MRGGKAFLRQKFLCTIRKGNVSKSLCKIAKTIIEMIYDQNYFFMNYELINLSMQMSGTGLYYLQPSSKTLQLILC